MNYSDFFNMLPELTLIAALLVVFFMDFFCPNTAERKAYLGTGTILMLMPVISTCLGSEPSSAFGGIYVASDAINVMKAILAFGTLVVVVMSKSWVENNWKLSGEFHMLLLSTLLGMFMMMSSGSFLLFFLGLETASVPLACMVAFDRHRKESAEGAAKYILVATFSSGVMLFGISFIYAATCASWVWHSSSADLVSRFHLFHSTSGLLTHIRVLQLL